MRYSIRLLLAASLVFATPALADGQVRPTPDQAKQVLATRPDLVAQLKQRIMTSGMTPDQVRARLRAEGYPPDLLDAYLSDASGADSSAVPTSDVFAAIVSLGVADSSDLAKLRLADSTYRLRKDSLGRADSSRDSLKLSARDTLRLRLQALRPRGNE